MATRRQFRFANSVLQNRSRAGKPVWLWKWTSDAWHKFKQYKRKSQHQEGER